MHCVLHKVFISSMKWFNPHLGVKMIALKIFSISLLIFTEFGFLDGNKFIPGKGCGTTTPIKILDKMPADTANMECVIINEEIQIEENPDAFSKYFIGFPGFLLPFFLFFYLT